MYFDVVLNRDARSASLLCEGRWVRQRTLVKLGTLRRAFQNATLVSPEDACRSVRSRPHG